MRKLEREQTELILTIFWGAFLSLLFSTCFSNKLLSICVCACVFTNCSWIVIWLVPFCALIVKGEHFMETYFGLQAIPRVQLS